MNIGDSIIQLYCPARVQDRPNDGSMMGGRASFVRRLRWMVARRTSTDTSPRERGFWQRLGTNRPLTTCRGHPKRTEVPPRK